MPTKETVWCLTLDVRTHQSPVMWNHISFLLHANCYSAESLVVRDSPSWWNSSTVNTSLVQNKDVLIQSNLKTLGCKQEGTIHSVNESDNPKTECKKPLKPAQDWATFYKVGPKLSTWLLTQTLCTRMRSFFLKVVKLYFHAWGASLHVVFSWRHS